MTERLLSEYVPWRAYFADDVLGLTNGDAMMMLGIDGLPFETIDDPVINHRHNRLEAALRNASQPGLVFHFLQCRGTADDDIYPDGPFRTAFAERLDARYKAKLFGDRSMWLNRTYLAVQLPRRQIGGKAIHRLMSGGGSTEPTIDQIERLRRIVGILAEELKEYRPKVLGVVRRGNALFSEIAEAVAFAMTGYWRQVPMTTSGASAIFSETIIVGHEGFEVRMPHRSSWGACLSLNDFPYMTWPGMLDSFLSAKYRHTVLHAFRCLAPMDGEALATRKQNRMRQAGDRALKQSEELTTAAELIAMNQLMIGEHAGALTVFADRRESLPEVIRIAWADLSVGGSRVERESVSLEAVMASVIPGNFHLRGRQAAISSRNFAAFAAMHNFPAGERKGFWGDPIAVFRTSGGTPYCFHLHHEGVGNCFVSGATGSGKSTWLGGILSQSERSGAQIVVWDKDRGLETLVIALDGVYTSLANDTALGTGLAPLKRLTNSSDDVTFLSSLIRACIATPQPYNLTPEEDRRLGIALRHVMALPSADRCMEEVRAFLGTSRDGAGARLEKFIWGGEYGWVIDCPHDRIPLDGKVLGFDQSALLSNSIASGAVLATLFHYTGKLVDGRRMLFVLDEVWAALLNEQFTSVIHAGLKTWRKYSAPLIIATQSVADALSSPIAHTIREQCPVQVYFSNPRAIWKDYGDDGMHLTETEFDIVQKLPAGQGHFLLKQGSQSVVAQFPLSGLDDEIAVISGTRRSVQALDMAKERVGSATGEKLIEEFHRARKEMAL